MNHELNPDELFAWHDGQLSPSRRAEINAHVRHCVSCRNAVEHWQRASAIVLQPLRVPDQERFVQNVMRAVRTLAPDLSGARWASFMRWAFPALAFSLTLCVMAFSYAMQPPAASTDTMLMNDQKQEAALWYSARPSEDQLLVSAVGNP